MNGRASGPVLNESIPESFGPPWSGTEGQRDRGTERQRNRKTERQTDKETMGKKPQELIYNRMVATLTFIRRAARKAP